MDFNHAGHLFQLGCRILARFLETWEKKKTGSVSRAPVLNSIYCELNLRLTIPQAATDPNSKPTESLKCW